MNNYAISTDGIATALQSSASALVTAGNDIDEAIALVTAGNTITQDPKKVGTGLRTIALRLTGTKEAKKELEEMGEDVEGMYETQAKLREDIMNATQVASNNFQGFDILNDNGNYKSTYEILLGIADIYDEILAKDKEQGTNFSNFLLEAMAGKTRANILASIFQNADVLRESFEDSQNSFGSAMEENDKYLQSISGHIARLSNSYQELWATSTNRETVNFFIDLANAIVSAASKLGLLKTALLAVTGITILKGGISKKGLAGSLISGLGSFARLDGDTSTLSAAMNTLAQNTGKAEQSFSLLSALSPQLARGFGRIKEAGAGLWQIIKSTVGSITQLAAAHPLLTGAIVAATVAISAYIASYDKLNLSYKDTVEEVKQIRKEYNAAQSDIKDHAKAISEVSDEYERLSKGVNSETNANLSLSTDEYERYLEICNQIADMYPELVKGYDSQGNAILTLKGNVEGLTQALIDEKKAAAEAAINGGEAGDANSIMDAWRHVVNGRQTGYNREMSSVDSVDYLNRVLNWDLKQAGTFMDQISAGTEYDAQGLVQKYSQALINGKQEEIQLARKAIVEEINAMNMEVEQRLSDVKLLGNLYLTNDDDYYQLSERGQTMGNLLVEGMSQSMAEGFIDGEKGLDKTRVDAWTDNIIKNVQKIDGIVGKGTNTDGTKKSLLDNIFEFKAEDSTISKIRKFRKEAVDAFTGAGVSSEVTNDFFNQIGLNEDSIRDSLSRAYGAANNLIKKNMDDIAANTDFSKMFSNMNRDQLESFIEIANSSENVSDALQKWNDIKKVSISLSEDMAGALKEEQGKITGIQTALSEATSATGLTFGNKNYLQGLFGNFEDFDYDEMYKRTATGIKIDERVLNNLNVERAKQELADYNNALVAVMGEEQRISEAMKTVEFGSEAYAQGQKNLELLRERKTVLAEEVTQYEALISTYNRWIQTQSQADQRSNWESMASGFDRVDQLVNAGFIGDAEVRSWIDLMTYEDMATASVEEYMETYKTLYDTIEGTSYSIKDFFVQGENGGLDASGLYNFIDALKQLEQSLGQDFADFDNMTIDVSNIDAIAKALNISKEAANELAFALEDIGWDVIGQQAITAVADANRALEVLNQNGIFNENGHHTEYQIDFQTTNEDRINTFISELQAKLEELQNDANFDFDTEGGYELTALIDYLETKINKIQDAKVTIHTNAEEAYQELKQLDEFKDLDVGFTLDSSNLSYVESMITKLLDLKQRFSESTDVRLNTQGVQEVDALLDAFIVKKQELSGQDIDFSILAYGDDAINELKYVEEGINAIDGKTATVSTNVNGVEESISQINNLNDSTDKVNGKTATSTVKVTVDDAELRAENQAPTVSNPIVKKVQVDKSEEQAYEAEKHEGTITMDVGINKEKVDEFMATDFNKEAAITFSVNDVDANLPVDGAYDITSTVTFDKDSKEVDKYDPDDLDRTVTYKRSSPSVDSYNPSNFNRTVNYGLTKTWELASFNPQDIYRTVHYNIKTTGGLPMVTGTAITNGHAYASGTAFAKGDWGTKNSGTALGGELGTELLVRDGKWQTIGEDGAEFFNYRRGDIIFNADQTRQLFEKGKITTGKKRATAYADGTASGLAFASGTKKEREIIATTDFVERVINKFAKAIDRLNAVVEDTTRNWGWRNTKTIEEIKQLNNQIENQKKAAQTYQKYINQIQKDYGLTKSKVNSIQNGWFGIEEFYNMSAKTGKSGSDSARENEDKKNRKYVEGQQKYTEYYDKMIASQDAVAELTSTIRGLFIDMFDQISTNYLGKQQSYELANGVLNQRISTIEAAGGVVSEKYYTELQKRENDVLTNYLKQRENMVIALNELVRNGTVGTNSEDYHRMAADIDAITQSIEESKTNLAEFSAEIRNIRWEKFDRLQQSLENIVGESDFLIDLLEGESESLYDKESGLLTDYGMAALGLHESNYEVYIQEAKNYAKELKAINEEIANDPSNQELLDRRQELLEAQRDSIAAAQDEKNTIKDLMTNTIEKEVESLKTLIKTYTDTLQAEKDLYNYQKNIRDKSQQVNNIRKQLSAYENDDSEEGRARRQQLEAQLADAEEALKDTQYDHYFTEHKELLDDLYTEYEKQAKERANNTDNLIKDAISAINHNSANISDTIATLASSYGYDLTDSAKTILNKDSSGNTDTKQNTASAISGATSQNNAITSTSNKNADTSVKGSRTSYGDSRADGWYSFNGEDYYVSNGQQAKGAQTIDGKQYYFDENTSQAVVGQKKVDGKWKYYDESSKAALTSQFKYIANQKKTVYYDKSGNMVYGWQDIGGKKYYFDKSSGAMAIGAKAIDKKNYYFNDKGQMQTGVITVGKNKYLYDATTGVRAGNGKGNSWVKQPNGKEYYVDKNGMLKPNQWVGDTFYTDSNGAAVTGWKTIGNKTYYFDPNVRGGAKTLWEKTINGKDYYFNGKGELYKGGWLQFKNNKKWKYFDKKTGEAKRGWLKDNGKWYYLDSKGWMTTGWQNINGKRYYFDSKGIMQTGERKIGQKYYLFNSSGHMLTGPQKVGSKMYLYGSDGARIGGGKTARWVDFNGKKYYVNSDGSLKTNAWVANNKKYVNGSGAMLTGWNKVSGKQYYFNGNGDKVTGWQTISGHRYNFGSDGIMKTGLQTIGGKKYHFNSKGWMTQNAWQTVSGKKYYFGNDGVAYVNGAKKINGKGYYFDKNGIMQANTTVTINKKKYKIDKNGVIQGYKRGVYSVGSSQMAWTQEGRNMEAIIRPSDGAILTPLAKGDSVLNSKATANLFDFANDPQKFLRELKSGLAISPKMMSGSKDVNIKNDVNLQVVLPNVQNYDEFKYALQHDKNFENMIRSMTTDKMFGGSSLAKYKFA